MSNLIITAAYLMIAILSTAIITTLLKNGLRLVYNWRTCILWWAVMGIFTVLTFVSWDKFFGKIAPFVL